MINANQHRTCTTVNTLQDGPINPVIDQKNSAGELDSESNDFRDESVSSPASDLEELKEVQINPIQNIKAPALMVDASATQGLPAK
ncbi:hypothetical protein PtA15_3A1 [Puccinia triticina]|uniref:Uncharacterized protein n=1 Tax=Puccinia triticina TaxID=208348 RepID=A0ABY7CCJ4_9BASI|nr:uncharacterized protein PtA15_3A1 [Puccinia triticina]WAQ82638.1 hypothetical protein PtA15_3A1 [Puccinia triticina]